MHVRSHNKGGSISTPLELTINNQIDRFSLAIEVIDRVPGLQVAGAHAREKFCNQRNERRNHSHKHDNDKPETVEWRSPA